MVKFEIFFFRIFQHYHFITTIDQSKLLRPINDENFSHSNININEKTQRKFRFNEAQIIKYDSMYTLIER